MSSTLRSGDEAAMEVEEEEGSGGGGGGCRPVGGVSTGGGGALSFSAVVDALCTAASV